MRKFQTVVLAACACLALSCSTGSQSLPFNTSYSAPADWKVVEDPKWGLRFNLPPYLQDVGYVNNSLWIHKGPNIKFVVDYSLPPVRPDSLKLRSNYRETRLRINGLQALVCSYYRPTVGGPPHLDFVAALFFLEAREGLGSSFEPTYRVEFESSDQLELALQILQTVKYE